MVVKNKRFQLKYSCGWGGGVTKMIMLYTLEKMMTLLYKPLAISTSSKEYTPIFLLQLTGQPSSRGVRQCEDFDE